jgi:hypothetical protein
MHAAELRRGLAQNLPITFFVTRSYQSEEKDYEGLFFLGGEI